MSNLFLGFLLYLWNIITHYQKPITYGVVETPNRYMSHEILANGITHIFEVKQLKHSRTPRKPFIGCVVYQYEVTQYVFKEGLFQNSRSSKQPEYSFWLFRNTKIPHILAINAFLNAEIEFGGN